MAACELIVRLSDGGRCLSGASGNVATEAVARAAPDGYTLLLVSAGNAINMSLYENLNFDLIRDIAPVAGVVSFPMVITVRSPFPASTLTELVAYAEAKPGKMGGRPAWPNAQDVVTRRANSMRCAVLVVRRIIPCATTPA